MAPEEVEEFAGEFKLRLVEDDYAIVRQFQGRSTFGTYIAAVTLRALRDYRAHQFGKWNTSAVAKRLGAVAVDLERLLYRDGRSIDDVIEALQQRFPGTVRADLEALAARLPVRSRRRRISIDDVEIVQAPDVLGFEHANAAAELSAKVCSFIDSLPNKDQLLLRLRFVGGLSVAQIARSLALDQKVLYRELDRCYRDLRKYLEAAGVHANDINELVGSNAAVFDFHLTVNDSPTSRESTDFPTSKESAGDKGNER